MKVGVEIIVDKVVILMYIFSDIIEFRRFFTARCHSLQWRHMIIIVSKITDNSTVCSIAYKAISKVSLKFCLAGFLWPVDSPCNESIMRKSFPSSWRALCCQCIHDAIWPLSLKSHNYLGEKLGEPSGPYSFMNSSCKEYLNKNNMQIYCSSPLTIFTSP